jgi:hypothetical protein
MTFFDGSGEEFLKLNLSYIEEDTMTTTKISIFEEGLNGEPEMSTLDLQDKEEVKKRVKSMSMLSTNNWKPVHLDISKKRASSSLQKVQFIAHPIQIGIKNLISEGEEENPKSKEEADLQ